MNQQPTEHQTRTYAAAISILLLLSLLWGGYQWRIGGTLKKENEVLSKRTDSLKVVRDNLQRELEGISSQLEAATAQNQSLSASISGINEKLAEKDKMLSRLQKENQSLSALRKQVNELKTLKESLSNELASIKQENTRLRADNSRLSKENEDLRRLNADKNVNSFLPKEEESSSSLLGANAFRVEVMNRKEKLIVKGRRAREVAIMFDLPEGAKGGSDEIVYLSLKDITQKPLKDARAKDVNVNVKGVMNPVTVHLTKAVDFTRNPQRVTLKYKLDEKLKTGVYVAELFTEKLFVGKVEFRLR
jgi:myosin heavy subunit